MRRAVGAAVFLLSGLAFAGACSPAADPTTPDGARMDAANHQNGWPDAGVMNADPPPADSSDPRWGGHIGSGT